MDAQGVAVRVNLEMRSVCMYGVEGAGSKRYGQYEARLCMVSDAV